MSGQRAVVADAKGAKAEVSVDGKKPLRKKPAGAVEGGIVVSSKKAVRGFSGGCAKVLGGKAGSKSIDGIGVLRETQRNEDIGDEDGSSRGAESSKGTGTRGAIKGLTGAPVSEGFKRGEQAHAGREPVAARWVAGKEASDEGFVGEEDSGGSESAFGTVGGT